VLLKNLILLNENQPVNIGIYGEKIMSLGTDATRTASDPFQIDFTDAIAIPGLINSHEHLDFNCHTVLGERKYEHYTDWGKHIHAAFKENINAVLKIPLNLRTAWGMYKNLLAGVTTVVNHGNILKTDNPLIDIYQETQNLHSVGFEKNWKWKLNNPILRKKACVIHTGEGTDKRSSDEIDELIRYNLLGRNLIGVHGVAMKPEQSKYFKGLVWCPESNKVLLDHHAPITQLKTNTSVVFGSDSTLTGNWNIWKHLRLARTLQQVTDEELFDMITGAPARLWNMNKGKLQPKKIADIVVIKSKNGSSTLEGLFRTNPEDILLIVHKGQIRLFDKSLLPQFRNLPVNLFRYSQISYKDDIKFVEGELPGLIAEIKRYNPNVNFPVEVFETINQAHYD
jgi:cytosine/adenosine deaminase-related metal-dependent hydrolase